MKSIVSTPRRSGSALVVALIMVGILASLAAATFMVLNNKYRVVHQAASWQEALLTAEAGVDMGMTEIRRQLYDSEALWSGKFGWNLEGTRSTSKQVLLREGEGGTESWAEVTVEWPEDLKDPSGEQWYKITSHGYCQISGGQVAAGSKEDLRLRKLSLHGDRRASIDGKSSAEVETPNAHRVIEAIAKPQYAFRMALFGVRKIDLTNHNILVDSYDSRDPDKSNWPTGATEGTYPWNDPTDHSAGIDEDKRQWNGDIGTNGEVINAGNAHIYGTANTNGGTVLDDDNVTGNYPNDPNRVRDDFSMAVPGVKAPSDSGQTQTTVDPRTGIQATTGTGTRIVVPNINLSGQEVLNITGQTGVDTYVEIVVTGNITVTGQAQIVLDPGVHGRIFLQGDADVGGKGFTNPGSPLNLQIYGTERTVNTTTGEVTDPGNIKIAGNGGFSGSVYAPHHNVELKGGGTTNDSSAVYGAFAGYTVLMNGVTAVHYDEALGDGGLVTGYNVVSWFEDER
ncbi:MAG TPA: hypothetical protein VFG14_03315 [Chthoniobacteraceae bacterium]|nr:hypothetical protein [Chthoniobacteraceae bacterium]